MRRYGPTSSSPVKRWAVKLALCLLVGALVTWGVAWGCAMGAHNSRRYGSTRTAFAVTEGGVTIATEPVAYAAVARVFGAEVWILQHPDTDKFITSYFIGRRGEKPLPPPVIARRWWMIIEAGEDFTRTMLFGWPLRSMLTVGRFSTVPPFSDQAALKFGVHELPTRILPLGFALNTLLAAGMVLGMVEGGAWARRRRRLKRGRCPRCGYERRGLSDDAACPECGAAAAKGT